MLFGKNNTIISEFSRIHFLICFVILSTVNEQIFSQSIPFGQLTAKQGLSNSFVNCLLQDHYGFIWFGTDDGLNRFDGYEIKVYRNNPDAKSSISENIIWAMYEDRSGYLWIGTKSGGLNKYDPRNDSFEHFKLDSTSTDEINITCIYEDSKNNLWIGSYKHGLFRFNPSKNKFDHWQNTTENLNLLSDNFITSILEDNNSGLWISTYSGLTKYTPDQVEQPFKKVLPDLNIPVWSLSKSTFSENSFWMGTLNGLLKFNFINEEFVSVPLPINSDLQFANSVSSVAEEIYSDEKILWIGTFGGLVRLNLITGYSERFTQSKKANFEFLSNQVQDMLIDKSGVVWFATENGVNIYSPKNSKFNSTVSIGQTPAISPELFNKSVRAITQTKDGTIWFGTDAGLFEIKNNAGNQTSIWNSELQSLNIWSLSAGSSGNIWIGTYGQGLKELDLKTNNIISPKIDNPTFNLSAFNYIKTIIQDVDGKLWMGFWGAGLAKLNPVNGKVDHWRNEPENPTSLSFNDVWSLYMDRKGRLWIGTNGGGLDLFNEDTSAIFYNWNSNNKEGKKLSSDNIYTIRESVKAKNLQNQTVLWIGTANGLNKFLIKNDSGSRNGSQLDVEIKYFTVENGLSDNAIESIIEDDDGNLWIGTGAGISFFNTEGETFINFSASDGLIGSSFNSSAGLKTSNGLIYFGCTTGLNYFNPKNIKQSTFSPAVIITDFQLFNQPSDTNNNSNLPSNIFTEKEITLSYYQNDFSFQFASFDYNAPEKNQYAYMLVGFDKSWIFCGTRRFVTYTNLDPGEYTFRVKATNSDGVWNEKGTQISIIITPPFWKTWWAYSIYAIAFVGCLLLIRSAETRRRKKKEEERLRRLKEAALLREAELKAKNIEQEKEIEKQKIRNRIAQDLHDEIGSNLSSISLMSELIQKDEKINEEAAEKIKRIRKVAKGSIQAIRDIVWLTNPSSDSLKDLISKMKQVADDLLIKYITSIDYPKDVPEINLLPETKRNLFLIYKESLNNIVKHSGAKRVDIRFNLDINKLFLSIKDDGKGFDISSESGGNGLKNIKSRANEIDAELNFESQIGKGTLLELNINITHLRD